MVLFSKRLELGDNLLHHLIEFVLSNQISLVGFTQLTCQTNDSPQVKKIVKAFILKCFGNKLVKFVNLLDSSFQRLCLHQELVLHPQKIQFSCQTIKILLSKSKFFVESLLLAEGKFIALRTVNSLSSLQWLLLLCFKLADCSDLVFKTLRLFKRLNLLRIEFTHLFELHFKISHLLFPLEVSFIKLKLIKLFALIQVQIALREIREIDCRDFILEINLLELSDMLS